MHRYSTIYIPSHRRIYVRFYKKAAHIITANQEIIDWLISLNTYNRNIKREHVKWIKQSIIENKFMLTGQGIGVSTTGCLVDGQHRLLAIKESGYPPVELLVVTGLADESQLYVDQNARRSIADVMKLAINQSVSNFMVRLAGSYLKIRENDDNTISWLSTRPSLDKVVEVMTDNYETFSEFYKITQGKMRAAYVLALVHFGQRYNMDVAKEFAKQIVTGELLSADDVAYKMRASIEKFGRRVSTVDAYRYMITACIAYAKNDRPNGIRASESWAQLPKFALQKVA